jgi:hypothetical protein
MHTLARLFRSTSQQYRSKIKLLGNQKEKEKGKGKERKGIKEDTNTTASVVLMWAIKASQSKLR